MIIRHLSAIPDVVNFLSKSDTWTFDIESNGLNVRKNTLIGFGCSTLDLQAFYIITKRWIVNPAYEAGGYLETVLENEQVAPIYEILKTKRLITFNGSFDTRLTYHDTGTALWNALYADVMLMAHTCNENRFSFRMKDIAAETFGAHVKDEQEAMTASILANGGVKGEVYRADSELVAQYGLQDAILTARLFNHFSALLEKDKLTKFFFDDEVMPLYRHVTIPMELRGVNVDIQYATQLQAELSVNISQLEDEIQTAIKPYLGNFEQWYIEKEVPFKLTGPSRQKLAEIVGAPEGWPRTDKGAYSFSKVEIEKAIKKGLMPAETPLERYTISMADRVPADLQRQVQLALLADQGQRYIFNLDSKDYWKRIFFGYGKTKSALNEEPISKTKKGAPQFDEDTIVHFSTKYEWCETLRVYNKLNKLRGTYIDNFIKKSEDGIFYPQFNQHKTTSGRYSGDMQQLPRIKDEDDERSEVVRYYTNKIRNCIVSAPGWKFVDADYTSLEVVVFADDAGDEALLDIIRNNYDFYSQVAIQVKGLKEYSADKSAPNFLKKHKPAIRQQAKAYALGIRYGEQAYKLHKELNISKSEAEEIRNNYLRSFPGLKKRMDELIISAKKHGFVRSKTGRIRRYPELSWMIAKYGNALFDGLELWREYNEMPALYKEAKSVAGVAKNLINNALNFPIQSMAASIVSRASVEIMRDFEAADMQAYIALSVHDEICIHCPEHEVEEVARIMQFRMENTIKLSVPLQAEPIVGTRYGEVK